MNSYRGRLAPSPSGLLHLGHARTFWIAYQRALAAQGALVLRNEDLDPARSRPEFAEAMLEDLHWLGIAWQEGPGIRGAFAPYAPERATRPLSRGLEDGCLPRDGSIPAAVRGRIGSRRLEFRMMTKESTREPAVRRKRSSRAADDPGE